MQRYVYIWQFEVRPESRAEYERLDRLCQALTVAERRLGSYDELVPAAVAPDAPQA